MHPPPAAALSALSRFGLEVSAKELICLGNAGGFSGAQIWKVIDRQAIWCLRRWPTGHPDESQLMWIHQILLRAVDHGIEFVPALQATLAGATVVRLDGHFWELTKWMPGEATYWKSPSPQKLTNAMRALARFHQAVEPSEVKHDYAPAIATRRQRLAEWRMISGDPDWKQRLNANRTYRRPLDELLAWLPTDLEPLSLALDQASQQVVPLQACLRDVWHDHILFCGDEVSGIIDFGAMRIDSVATDIARLVGSLVGDEADAWQTGLRAYESIRPLSVEERSLLATLDGANLMLSTVNWIRWLGLEGRRFENDQAVLDRMNTLLQRLQNGHDTLDLS